MEARKLKRIAAHYRDDGIQGVNRAVHKQLQNSIGGVLSRFTSSGTNVFSRDWDLLIILDACRLDLFEEVVDEYGILDANTPSIKSVGSTSAEWMKKTFYDENFRKDISETTYITANPHTNSQVEDSQFHVLDEVWKYAWDEEHGTVKPRPLTDKTISIFRNEQPKRVITHYMQPHYPFLLQPDISPKELQGDIWQSLRDGDYTHDEIWEAYRDNLRVVLDDIELLQQNVSADKIVVTSDHGNALGESRIYGHPPGFPLNCLREVPWVVLTGNDSKEHSPEPIESKSKIEGW